MLCNFDDLYKNIGCMKSYDIIINMCKYQYTFNQCTPDIFYIIFQKYSEHFICKDISI